jgi:hypothetical protein
MRPQLGRPAASAARAALQLLSEAEHAGSPGRSRDITTESASYARVSVPMQTRRMDWSSLPARIARSFKTVAPGTDLHSNWFRGISFSRVSTAQRPQGYRRYTHCLCGPVVQVLPSNRPANHPTSTPGRPGCRQPAASFENFHKLFTDSLGSPGLELACNLPLQSCMGMMKGWLEVRMHTYAYVYYSCRTPGQLCHMKFMQLYNTAAAAVPAEETFSCLLHH